MIESFKQLEEVGRDRDLAEVFLEVDAQEHGVPGDQILSALRKRREVMRDCVERGKSGGLSMGKLVGNEAKKLNEAFAAGKTFLDPLTIKAELYALAVMGENSRMGVIVAAPTAGAGASSPACCWRSKKSGTSTPRRRYARSSWPAGSARSWRSRRTSAVRRAAARTK